MESVRLSLSVYQVYVFVLSGVARDEKRGLHAWSDFGILCASLVMCHATVIRIRAWLIKAAIGFLLLPRTQTLSRLSHDMEDHEEDHTPDCLRHIVPVCTSQSMCNHPLKT